MPLILGSNAPAADVYEVDNSLRFDDGSSDYLSKNFGSAGDRKTWTWSGWVKRANLGVNQDIFTCNADAEFYFRSNDKIKFYDFASGSTEIETSQVFRDVSAWYHIVLALDTTQATASNRFKLYINGNQITDFGDEIYPTLNENLNWNDNISHSLGRRDSANSQFFDGYMSEVVFIDGTALDPTSFGEFDNNDIWKPIDVSGLTFGTNGFYLEFKDSSALGDDTSGNSNDFTVNNLTSVDQSTDTPTNNFATFNPLLTYPPNPPALSEGNLKVETVDSDPGNFGGASTIGVSQGKWYFESTSLSSRELVPFGGGSITHGVGIHSNPAEAARQGTTFAPQVTGGVWYASNGKYYSTATGTGGSSYGSTFAHNDIIGVAIDLDNHKAYFSINGTFQNSGDPTSGSTGTGAISIPTGLTYFAFVTDIGGSANTSSINFGSPINTISSGNSDANGYGNFEYAVPSGYYALNTKNLAEYG